VSGDVNDRSSITTMKSRLRRYPRLYSAARTARHWVAAAVSSMITRRGKLSRRRSLLAASRRHEISLWRQSGSPVPPPHAYKQMTVAAYRRAFGLTTLVETGTYLGDMIEAQRERFQQVWSIELSPELYRAARAKFAHAGNVTLLQGDSGEVIESVVTQVKGPALFWLDGHYSAGITARGSLETPVKRELEIVLGSANCHVILVDDARCFGTGDFPTLDDVRALVARLRPGWTCVAKDDIIRIYPPTVSGLPPATKLRRMPLPSSAT